MWRCEKKFILETSLESVLLWAPDCEPPSTKSSKLAEKEPVTSMTRKTERKREQEKARDPSEQFCQEREKKRVEKCRPR